MWKHYDARLRDEEADALRAKGLRQLRDAIGDIRALQGLAPIGDTSHEPQVAFHRAVEQLLSDARRGTGRTSAALLDVVARAVRQPDEWVVCDEPHSEAMAERLAEHLRTARPMGVRVDVRVNGSRLEVRSPLSRLRCAEAVPE